MKVHHPNVCYWKACNVALLTIAMLMLCCVSCIGALDKAFAYISYTDGTIDQYKVTPNGNFIPLSPANVHLDVNSWTSQVVVDPSKCFAYTTAGDYVYQFKINEDGTLFLLKKTLVSTEKHPMNVAVDKTGHFAYVTLNHVEGGDVAQYRINEDGTLSPLQPAAVPAGRSPGFVAVHPTKPVLYVGNYWDGTVSLYVINTNGTLHPLSPSTITVGGAPGNIAFSANGKYACITNDRNQSIELFAITGDGNLKCLSIASYQNDNDLCCGSSTITVDSNGSVFTCDSVADTLSEFSITNGHKIKMVADYKLTRDNNLKTREETIESVRRSMAKEGKKLSDIDAMNEELRAVGAVIASAYTAVFGPDGVLYVVNTSGVARFRINGNTATALDSKGMKKGVVSADTITALEPAITWPDMLKIKERNAAARGISVTKEHNPAGGLTFVTR